MSRQLVGRGEELEEELQEALLLELVGRFNRDWAPEVEVVETGDDGFLEEGYSPGVLEGDKIKVSRGVLEERRDEDLAKVWANQLEEAALEEVFNEKVDELSDELDIEIEGDFDARYEPLIGGVAEYRFTDQTMVHDTKDGSRRLGNVRPADPAVVTDDLFEKDIAHEVAHLFQYETRERFSHLHDLIEEVTDTQDEFGANLDNAGIEALSRFEEDPRGVTNHGLMDARLGDKWKLPDALAKDYSLDREDKERSYLDGGSGFDLGHHLYSGPYAMAEVIAYTVKNHFKRQEHVDDPVEETRNALYDIVGSANHWEEIMEGIWSDWGVPNYHELFKENYTVVQNDPVYAEDKMDRLVEELEGTGETEEDLELFYEAKSFVHAYQESGREEPEELDRVEELADTRARDNERPGFL